MGRKVRSMTAMHRRRSIPRARGPSRSKISPCRKNQTLRGVLAFVAVAALPSQQPTPTRAIARKRSYDPLISFVPTIPLRPYSNLRGALRRNVAVFDDEAAELELLGVETSGSKRRSDLC